MKSFKFVEKRNLWYFLSLFLILSAFSLCVSRFVQSKPLFNYGIDFLGGNAMILHFDALDKALEKSEDLTQTKQLFIADLRGVLQNYGLSKLSLRLSKDQDVLIKTLHLEGDRHQGVLDALRARFGAVEVLEIDYIGPSIGAELRKTSVLIIALVSLFLLMYISLRFQFAYGLAALLALMHDALMIFSFAAIFSIELDTAFIAALLTVLGYSINDTIVVFDRIRENRALHFTGSYASLVNLSLNQTLARTFNTSMTTFFVVSALIVFGGITINQFCIVLLIGIVSGTYSSLCIASPFLSQCLIKRDVSDI
eukprot:COSAG01_NODE_4_length_55812_cov_1344.168109_16_plen_310_part_00